MLAFNRWHIVLIASIILFLSLFQFLRYNSYDVDDVLQYVSSTVKQGGHDAANTAHSAVNNGADAFATVASPVTVTITHTQAAPTVTETVTVEKEKESDGGDSHGGIFSPIAALNMTINLPKHPMVFDPNGPKSNEIIFLTATDGGGHNKDVEGIVEMAAGNRKSYCDHHGYIYSFINISKYDIKDVPPVWKKLPAMVEAFNDHPEAQWLFWLDLDAIIMSPEQDLQSLILSKEGMRKHFHLGAELSHTGTGYYFPREPDFENVDFIIAQDHNGINAGSFFLRRTQFTQMLLDLWVDPFYLYAPWERLEQDAVVHMLKHHQTIREHTGIAKQRAINAFSTGQHWMKWTEGDLLVHFAGCWVTGECADKWTEYWDQRGHLKKRSPVKP